MSDRYNLQSQLEHLQSKYIGTGHADQTALEHTINQSRDQSLSFIQHSSQLDFFSIALGCSRERTKLSMLHNMVNPVKQANTQTSNGQSNGQ